MNIYYTAKDIEELVKKGIYELELGPNTSLTDFARETANQLNVALIDGAQAGSEPSPEDRVQVSSAQAELLQAVSVSQAYNKPRGCQTGSEPVRSRPVPAAQGNPGQPDSAPVNRLVDLMGKIINRGD